MKDIIISPQLSISTPFVMNNDGVRCQMAASQCRQAVPLENNEPPIVETTLERSRILEPDIIRSPEDCEVIFSSSKLIVVKTISGIYKLYRVSYRYKIPKEGTIFRKGDIISYKEGYFDNEGNLAQGKNLTCAVMLHPWGYQDAIVLGDHVDLTSFHYHVIERIIPQNCILLSLDKQKYKILPEVGEKIKAFDPILIIKKNDPNRILEDPETISINEDSEVIEVDLVGNEWNKDIRAYDVAILEFLQQKTKLKETLEKKISDPYIVNEICRYHYLYDYFDILQKQNVSIKYGKENFDLYVRIVLRSKRPIEVGDKLSNRHANKGVISLITNEVPTLTDGRKIDIIVDLMSIPSRMNLGQVYEVIAGNCIYYLQKKLKEFTNLDQAKEYIMGFYEIIDNTQEQWIIEQTKKILDSIQSIEELHNLDLTFPAPPFESTSRDQLIEACIYLNPSIKQNLEAYFNQNEYEELPDLSPLLEIANINGKQIYVTAGPMYFYKLVHMAREKISARGVGKIMKKTMQPTGGRRNQGGQRFGEMEVWCLLAYGALFNLHEILRLKSDDIQQKVSYMLKKLYESDLDITKTEELEVVKLFKAYLQVLRTKLEE